jgi:hypothetical protein
MIYARKIQVVRARERAEPPEGGALNELRSVTQAHSGWVPGFIIEKLGVII